MLLFLLLEPVFLSTKVQGIAAANFDFAQGGQAGIGKGKSSHPFSQVEFYF